MPVQSRTFFNSLHQYLLAKKRKEESKTDDKTHDQM